MNPVLHAASNKAALILAALFATLFLLSTACGGGDEELVIYSSRTSSLVQPLLEKYAADTGRDVRVRYANTASIVATLLEEGDNSPADVVYLAEPSGWGVLSEAGALAQLPVKVLDQVDGRFRSSIGEWVGTSGRSKVVVYNTDTIEPAQDLPDSILDFTDSKWKGRIGWAPSHGEWQITLMAIRLERGEEAARQWLEAIKANDPRVYPNLISIVKGVADGEVDVGFVNHYYVPRYIAEEGSDFKARNHYIGGGDPGAVIDVAGVGIHKLTDSKAAAEDFVEFMLTAEAQRYFAEKTFEYPVASGITPIGDLPPLSSLDPPNIDPADLSELEATTKMLRDSGIIP